MRKHVFFGMVLMAVMFAGVTSAEYYSWEDEAGAVHITDYPPPSTVNARNVKIYDQTIGQVTVTSDKQPEKAPEITLFTKNNCPDCDKARTFLKDKNLAFTEYNMDQDEKAAEKRKAIDDSQDVPFAVINKAQVYGFSETVYNRALKLTP